MRHERMGRLEGDVESEMSRLGVARQGEVKVLDGKVGELDHSTEDNLSSTIFTLLSTAATATYRRRWILYR